MKVNTESIYMILLKIIKFTQLNIDKFSFLRFIYIRSCWKVRKNLKVNGIVT